jgi:hypothetical protein
MKYLIIWNIINSFCIILIIISKFDFYIPFPWIDKECFKIMKSGFPWCSNSARIVFYWPWIKNNFKRDSYKYE